MLEQLKAGLPSTWLRPGKTRLYTWMEPIRYTLSFPNPHTHYVEVRAEVPTSGRDEVELMMAVWTPGRT